MDAEKDNLDIDICMEPLLTNKAKPKKWGEKFCITK